MVAVRVPSKWRVEFVDVALETCCSVVTLSVGPVFEIVVSMKPTVEERTVDSEKVPLDLDGVTDEVLICVLSLTVAVEFPTWDDVDSTRLEGVWLSVDETSVGLVCNE